MLEMRVIAFYILFVILLDNAAVCNSFVSKNPNLSWDDRINSNSL